MTDAKNPADLPGAIQTAIQTTVAQRRIPVATYRVQFNANFTFQDAKALTGYLHDLGISDLYASPIFLPRTGSTHGYDVADPTRLNSALGSEADFDALSAALHQHKMGLVLDIVPNHMGINDARNGWWLDVLENGPSSDYASFFDIDWNPNKLEMANKVLLPILGDQYGVVLERGELKLNYAAGSFFLTYWETMLPVSPRSYILMLRHALELMPEPAEPELEKELEGGTPEANSIPTISAPALSSDTLARMELESIITALSYLPPRTEKDPQRLAERAREKEIAKRRLDALYNENAVVREALDATVRDFNGTVGKPASFDLLDELIDMQAYRLAFWRVAGEEINYRRFFDINELAAIRVEEAEVFAATHALALRLLAEEKATGLRVDHPDGLYDPVTYFCRLQEHYLLIKVRAALGDRVESDEGEAALLDAVDRWLDEQAKLRERAQWPLYVVAEKILTESEPLPQEWAVQGTTGYDFLAAANGIFVDQRNEKLFTRLYSRFTGNRTSLRELTFSTKMMIMRASLAGEITTLAHELERIGEGNRHYRDFTLGGIRTALREVVAALSIYRTYIDAHQGVAVYDAADAEGAKKPPTPHVSERDRKFIQAAVREAKRRHPLLDDTIFDYIRDTLLLRNMGYFDSEDRARIARWIMKFQQLTGPVMAKGVEDTAFYRYNRLVSLNEVGAHPAHFGISVEAFHRENAHRAEYWSHAMLATSTHDNKRSEDVRARINVLASLPDRWQAALRQWSRLNASKKRELDGETAPDANDEYLFYQTLLGTWPIAPAEMDQEISPWGFLLQPGDTPQYQEFRERIRQYMLKAAKEAKVYTSWLNPYEEYEEALLRFVDRVLQPGSRNRFLINLAPLARQVAYFGHFNSLAQTLLKLTVPGVPDIYQGNEIWDFSLVDPDNRRPVDYALRRKMLKDVQTGTARKGKRLIGYVQDLVHSWHDGRIKLYVTQRTLHFRRTHVDLFTDGAYVPLAISGTHNQHLCAYLRYWQGEEGQVQQALTIVPRLVPSLTNQVERPPTGADVWGDTAIVVPAQYAAGEYRNLFTGATLRATPRDNATLLPAADVLAHFPVAVLTPATE